MQIVSEKLPKSQVKLTITVPVGELAPHLDAAAAKISQEVKIEGFRPGKAPRNLVETKVGAMAVLQEAVDAVVQATYPEAVAQEKLKDVGMPEIKIEKMAPGNDLVYTATVAILPNVVLADAKKAKAERKNPSVTPEDVQKTLAELQKMHAKEVAEERAAAKGDKVDVDFQVFVDNVPIEGGTSKNHPVTIGANAFIPGFEEQLVGMKRDEDKEFELEFPKEYHESKLAGKKATFKVKAKTVYKIELPVVDDTFAKSLGGFQSLDELKKQIEKNMLTEREQKEQERLELEVLEKIAEKSKFDEIPDVMLENELDRMLREMEQQVGYQGGDFEDYLSHIKKSREDLRKEWRPQAEKRVKTALIVAEVIEQQKLTVPDAAIDAEIALLKKAYGQNQDVLKRLDSLDYRAYQRMVLLNRKAVDWLVKTALGEDPSALVVKDGQTEGGILVE